MPIKNIQVIEVIVGLQNNISIISSDSIAAERLRFMQEVLS